MCVVCICGLLVCFLFLLDIDVDVCGFVCFVFFVVRFLLFDCLVCVLLVGVVVGVGCFCCVGGCVVE